jgi:predicted dehydrogenase
MIVGMVATKPLRVGIVGLISSYSVLYPPDLLTLPGVKLVGAAHLGHDDKYIHDSLAFPWLAKAPKSREAWTTTYDAPLSETAEQLYDSGVDAVVICTEDYLRTRYAMAALERGLHVFLPKPFAYTAEDACGLRDAATKSTATAVPALPLRYHPAYQRAKELLTPDRFGRPVAMRASVTHHLTAGPWKSDPAKAAGPEFESGFYNVDALLYLADEPVVSVYAQAQSYFLPGVPPWDTARSLLTFKGSAVATADFNCGLEHHFTGQELEAVAPGGALRLERGRGVSGGTVLRTFTADGEAEEPAGPAGGGSGKASELANWVEICRRGDKAAAEALFATGCQTLEALLAFQRSCRSHQVEAVEPI